MKPGSGKHEAGYTLVALVATMAISMVLMAAGTKTWRYLVQDSNEEELLFRGKQIADAIQRYQKKNANALPPSLEVLVKGKFLRKAYKDPMTKDGKWRFMRPGEAIGAPPVARPGLPGTPSTTQPAFSSSTTARTTVGGSIGLIQGVASTSTETSLRIVNGRTKYNEWIFLPGQAIVVGRAAGFTPAGAPGVFPGANPAGGSPPPTTPRSK
jgi:type II secretory pathway pseudopilin PulG